MNLTKLQPTLAAGLLSLTLMFTSHPSSANILDGSYDDNNDNDNYNAEQQLSNQRWLQYQQQVANQQVTLSQNSNSAYSNYDATATSSSADTTDSQVTDQNTNQNTNQNAEPAVTRETIQPVKSTPAHFSSVEPVTVMLNHQGSDHPLVEQPQLTAGNRFLPLTNLSQVLNQQIREAPMTTWNLLNLNTNNPLANNVIGNNRPFDNLQQYYQ